MPFLTTDIIEPGDTTAATDGDLLDDVETLVLDALNLRPECLTERHFDVDRAAFAPDTELPITTWIDSTSDDGTSTHGDIVPGTYVSFGGTDLELNPPNDPRSTLGNGDVLRWHFSAMVDGVDDSGNAELDCYHFAIEVAGVDNNGASTKGSRDSKEFGIIASYSMNQGGISAGAPGAGINQEISRQRVSLSGIYIHDASQNVFSVSGGPVRITAIKVRCWVQTGTNEITINEAVLTASIHQG